MSKSVPPPDPEPLGCSIFDAHTHLDAMAQRAGVEPDRDFVAAAMSRARGVGVTRVITVGDTLASSRWCVQAAADHPDVYAAVAVHPTEIAGLTDADYAELERLAAHEKVVAIGETGLDYYWDRTEPADQQRHFRRHLELAQRSGLPVMIHDRDAHSDVLRVLREHGAPDAGVIFHAFSGDEQMVGECVDAGYILSFAGVVTFTNAPGIRAAAVAAPVDRIMVETDAPFLTPHPCRGRPNAPYMLPYTLRMIAELHDCDEVEMAADMWLTARSIFGPAW